MADETREPAPTVLALRQIAYITEERLEAGLPAGDKQLWECVANIAARGLATPPAADVAGRDVPPMEHYTAEEWREKAITADIALEQTMDTAEQACEEAIALRAEVERLDRQLHTALMTGGAAMQQAAWSEVYHWLAERGDGFHAERWRGMTGLQIVIAFLEETFAERNRLRAEVERLNGVLRMSEHKITDLRDDLESSDISIVEVEELRASNARLRAAAEKAETLLMHLIGPKAVANFLDVQPAVSQLRAALAEEGGERG